jgi:hypothetical protein
VVVVRRGCSQPSAPPWFQIGAGVTSFRHGFCFFSGVVAVPFFLICSCVVVVAVLFRRGTISVFWDRDFSLLGCGGGVSDRHRSSFPVGSYFLRCSVAFVVVFLFVWWWWWFCFCFSRFCSLFLVSSVPSFSVWWWFFIAFVCGGGGSTPEVFSGEIHVLRMFCFLPMFGRRQICDGMAVVVSDLRRVW